MAYRVGAFGGQVRIDPPFDFDPQRAAGPARPGVCVDDSWDRSGRGFGRGNDLWVDTIGEAVHDIRGDPVPDVADEGGHR